MVGSPKKPQLLIAIALILIAIGIVFLIKPKKEIDHVTIILSPHFDDAVLSLGGLLSKHEHPTVVATFFTEAPDEATSTSWDLKSGFDSSSDAMTTRTQENKDALESLHAEIMNYGYMDNQYRSPTSTNTELELEITKDIQALLASYGDKTVDVYGPSIFSDTITHVDHALLHRAFVNVAKDYAKDTTHFYFYEDFPYIARFNRESVISLEKNLESDTGMLFEKTTIPLSKGNVRAKEKALEKYVSQSEAFQANDQNIINDTVKFTNSRCGDTACEVVYKLFKI